MVDTEFEIYGFKFHYSGHLCLTDPAFNKRTSDVITHIVFTVTQTSPSQLLRENDNFYAWKLGLYQIWLYFKSICSQTWLDLGTQIQPEPEQDLGRTCFESRSNVPGVNNAVSCNEEAVQFSASFICHYLPVLTKFVERQRILYISFHQGNNVLVFLLLVGSVWRWPLVLVRRTWLLCRRM